MGAHPRLGGRLHPGGPLSFFYDKDFDRKLRVGASIGLRRRWRLSRVRSIQWPSKLVLILDGELFDE